MDETGVNWWMDANNRWHRGRPPAAWWQAEDRRWHPPAKQEPVGKVRDGRPAGPAHFVSRSPTPVTAREWPRWALYVLLALVAVAAVMAIVAAAIIDSS
jgi:hypothetical protein